MKLSLSRVNFKWITYLKYLLFCFFVIEKMNILMMLLTWIKFAFSIPRSEPMTRTEKFVQWSSLFAYCITGFSFIAAPQLYNIILGLDYQRRSEGYIRLFRISGYQSYICYTGSLWRQSKPLSHYIHFDFQSSPLGTNHRGAANRSRNGPLEFCPSFHGPRPLSCFGDLADLVLWGERTIAPHLLRRITRTTPSLWPT